LTLLGQKRQLCALLCGGTSKLKIWQNIKDVVTKPFWGMTILHLIHKRTNYFEISDKNKIGKPFHCFEKCSLEVCFYLAWNRGWETDKKNYFLQHTSSLIWVKKDNSPKDNLTKKCMNDFFGFAYDYRRLECIQDGGSNIYKCVYNTSLQKKWVNWILDTWWETLVMLFPT
jgi:hypothetical protein